MRNVFTCYIFISLKLFVWLLLLFSSHIILIWTLNHYSFFTTSGTRCGGKYGKFTGEYNDLEFWKVNIQEILNQQRCIEVLIEEILMSLDLTKVEKVEMVGKVKCAIILCLRDKLLMKIAREKLHMRCG